MIARADVPVGVGGSTLNGGTRAFSIHKFAKQRLTTLARDQNNKRVELKEGFEI